MKALRNQQVAIQLFDMSGTDMLEVKEYLSSRAITIDPPETIRFLPSVHLDLPPDMAYLNRRKSMMVALVQNGAGDPIAIHHTSLVAAKDDKRRKMMLGPVKGGSIRLANHPVGGNKMAIGEGIESCLSFMQATEINTWSGMTEGGLRGFELPAEKPSTVYILADVDEEKIIRGVAHRVGQEAARKAAQRIANLGIETHIVWPGDPMGPKIDFNDLLRDDPTGESIRIALANAKRVESDTPQGIMEAKRTEKPVVRVIGGKLPDVVIQAETALISAYGSEIFQRSGMLVRTARVPRTEVKRRAIRREEGSLVIMPVDAAWLELRLTECTQFEKWGSRSNSWQQIDCPAPVSRALMSKAGEWRFDSLVGVIEAPTLRPDGSILDKHGYDDQTGLYLDTGGVTFPTIPEHPTREQAIAAVQVLEEAIAEFPFLADHHKAAMLAAILTALVRRSLRTAPLFVFTAPKMGSGKSLLANVVSMIATGRAAPAISHTTDPAEEKKHIFTILLGGDSIALLDNIENALKSSTLCSVLTEETYKARILGETRELTVPTAVTWMATGNNITVAGDLSTRVIMIRIDPDVERPEERSFKKNLKTWIPKNRPRLVAAGITILRAYAAAKRPATGLPPYGRFEEWARVVRDALVWCGQPDPCLTRTEVEDADPVRITLGRLLSAWWDVFGTEEITIPELFARAKFLANPPNDWMNPGGRSDPDSTLLGALTDVAGDSKGNLNARTMAWYLRKHRGRIECGIKVSEKRKQNSDTKHEMWSLVQTAGKQTEQSGTGISGVTGVTGVISIPPARKSNIHNKQCTTGSNAENGFTAGGLGNNSGDSGNSAVNESHDLEEIFEEGVL
ncbi:MAG: toprim domain-containing protein [Magnetococcales bacterium]|nr:toprim domain-containing protein [Magnetococcales bacterium]